MALTKSFSETVRARAQTDIAFRRELLREALETLLEGELEVGKAVLRDYIRVWYHDQLSGDERVRSASDVMWYAFKGADPDDRRNRWLKDALDRRLPLIYFYGVAPAVYEPLFPVYVVEWEAQKLSCALAVSPSAPLSDLWIPPSTAERRYAMRVTKQRLHQAMFRERVLVDCNT